MIMIRHGQSEFNAVFAVERVDPGIPDPRLTELGRAQAADAAAALAGQDVRRLIASPYTRALETAEIIAQALGLTVEIEPLVRERAAFHCDIGSAPADLKRRFPAFAFDHLAHKWWHDHVGLGEPEPESALLARCESFRARMAPAADWPHIAVVSHWGFIRGLTGQAVANCTMVRVPRQLAL